MNAFVAAATTAVAGTIAGFYYAGTIVALWSGVLAQLTPVLG